MDYHDLQDQMSLKQEIVSDFVRASLALSKMFHGEIAAKGFEQSQADQCASR